VIKDVIELRGTAALVIDHDLLFADYLSDRIMIFSGVPSKEGHATGPFELENGMNSFLKSLNITMRREPESHRPRINKEGSQLDSEQKKTNKYYY
jgi:ATP-binding cassette subfamily E protein 1